MSAAGARKFSEHLGFLTDEQIGRACDVFDLGHVEEALPAAAGTWGQNILLRTANGAFVLRGNPQFPEQFAKEQQVAAAINAGSSLPAPWPYHVNHDPSILGWPYAVMPRLPGRMGSTLWDAADEDARIALSVAHAAALAQLHEATFAAPGPFDPNRRT